jgi:hypothetical protein
VFLVGDDALMTLGDDDLLQNRCRRGKVRCGPSEEEKVVWTELSSD